MFLTQKNIYIKYISHSPSFFFSVRFRVSDIRYSRGTFSFMLAPCFVFFLSFFIYFIFILRTTRVNRVTKRTWELLWCQRVSLSFPYRCWLWLLLVLCSSTPNCCAMCYDWVIAPLPLPYLYSRGDELILGINPIPSVCHSEKETRKKHIASASWCYIVPDGRARGGERRAAKEREIGLKKRRKKISHRDSESVPT